MLDVDGTLLGFSDDSQSVTASPALAGILYDLHAVLDGSLALVSGRPLEDIDRIFGPTGWPAAELHGMELLHANGSLQRAHVNAVSQAAMHKAAAELTARFAGVQVEDERHAVPLHCRDGTDQLTTMHVAANALMPERTDYVLQPGHQALEFRPAGMDKVDAVRELLGRLSFSGHVPVHLDDDLTDEHAFKRIDHDRTSRACAPVSMTRH